MNIQKDHASWGKPVLLIFSFSLCTSALFPCGQRLNNRYIESFNFAAGILVVVIFLYERFYGVIREINSNTNVVFHRQYWKESSITPFTRISPSCVRMRIYNVTFMYINVYLFLNTHTRKYIPRCLFFVGALYLHAGVCSFVHNTSRAH